jgi:hypothetical protein
MVLSSAFFFSSAGYGLHPSRSTLSFDYTCKTGRTRGNPGLGLLRLKSQFAEGSQANFEPLDHGACSRAGQELSFGCL